MKVARFTVLLDVGLADCLIVACNPAQVCCEGGCDLQTFATHVIHLVKPHNCGLEITTEGGLCEARPPNDHFKDP